MQPTTCSRQLQLGHLPLLPTKMDVAAIPHQIKSPTDQDLWSAAFSKLSAQPNDRATPHRTKKTCHPERSEGPASYDPRTPTRPFTTKVPFVRARLQPCQKNFRALARSSKSRESRRTSDAVRAPAARTTNASAPAKI
jgi:hypothetical protein